MKYVIAELDRIAKYLEDIEEPWALHLAYRVDNCTQQLEDKFKDQSAIEKYLKLSSVSKSVMDQYLEDLSFLSEKENKIIDLVKKHAKENKNADVVYGVMKKHFGKLNKKESIKFINKILEKE